MPNVIALNHLSVHLLSSPKGLRVFDTGHAAPTESELIEDLNLSKRDELGTVYKPNPFSITKINAATGEKGGDTGTSNASKPGFKPQRNVGEMKHSAHPESVSKQSMKRKGSRKGTMKKLLLKTGLQRKGFSCNATASAASSPYRAHAPLTPSKPSRPALSSNSAHIPLDFTQKDPKTPSGTMPSPIELCPGPPQKESTSRSLDNFIAHREKAPCPPSVPSTRSRPSHTKVISSAIGSAHHTHAPFTPSGTVIPPNTTHIPDKIPSNEPIAQAVNYLDTSMPTAPCVMEEITFRPLNNTLRSSKFVMFSTSLYTPPGADHKAFSMPALATYASEPPARTTSQLSSPILISPAIMFSARPTPPEYLLYHPPSSSLQIPIPSSWWFTPRHAHFSHLPNQRKTLMNKPPLQPFSSPICPPTGPSSVRHPLKGPMLSPLGPPPARRVVEQAIAIEGSFNEDNFCRANASSAFALSSAPVSEIAEAHTSNGYGVTPDFHIKDEDNLAELHFAVDSSLSFRLMEPRLSSTFSAPSATKYSLKPDPHLQIEYIPARNRASSKLESDEAYPADQPLCSSPQLASFAHEPKAPVSNRNARVGHVVPHPQAPILSKNAKVRYTVPVRPPIDTSVTGSESNAVKRKRDVYSFSVDDSDEEWSTLPPKKGKKSTFKFGYVWDGCNTMKLFHISSLLGDGQRMGMSATSDRRVIMILPPLAGADVVTSKECPLTPPRSSSSRTVLSILPKAHAKIPLAIPLPIQLTIFLSVI
ncbi:hypothetical protein BDQ17DRAFT_1429872 [Cyathus striatus]|nr:hypothetical protein BDQ17DRAFT_1429872 [Cyathus striatus]